MASDAKSKAAFVLALPFFVVDLIVYIFTFGWVKKLFVPTTGRQQSVPGEEEATETHGAPRRSPKSIDALYKSDQTLHDSIMLAVEKYGDKVAMVSRQFVELKKLKETDRFPTKIYDDDRMEEITYRKLGDLIRNFGVGLRSLQKNEPSTMVIFEDTCKQWSIGMHGALSQSIVVATCYATLGDDAVVAAVNETEASTLLLNWKNVNKFLLLADKMPTLKTVIASTHEMPQKGASSQPSAKPGSKIQVLTWDDIIKIGEEKFGKAFETVPPKPDDNAVIMYTSGSTGKPKGVVMKHSQIMSGVQGMAMNVHLRPGKEVVVSYLPLAHVLALQIENAILGSGGKVCYSDPRSLAKTLPMFKPTVQAGVPKVYELLRGGLIKKIGQGPAIVKALFDAAFAWKSFMLSQGMDTPVMNALLFKPISKKVFGGVLQFAVSGGGSINGSLHDFCRVVFCCPIIQGYALTETCVGGCFQDTEDCRNGVVGPPVPCVEIMLQSEPEIKDSAGMPYLHTDTVSSKGDPVLGRGEICFRGPCISSGYYKMPEKTKEEYDADGWFHSGDIGQFTADGVIQIIDRKKNIVKLKGGEYVAVENMENAFNQSCYAMFSCVVANGDLDRPLVIVRADNEELKKWASDNGVSFSSLEELASNKELKQAVISSMKESGNVAGLTSLEKGIKDCCIITDVEWGAGSGLTASGKIDRAKIFAMHASELNAMLQRNGAPPLNTT